LTAKLEKIALISGTKVVTTHHSGYVEQRILI